MNDYTHETAPTQFVAADGIRYAYQRFGILSGRTSQRHTPVGLTITTTVYAFERRSIQKAYIMPDWLCG